MSDLTPEEKRQELEANEFAKCLLMPKQFIDSDLFGQDAFDLDNDKRIHQMAKRYGVSTQLMMIRLKELGYL